MKKEEQRKSWIGSLVDRYERPLCQYAYSILENPDLAREVVQDTFLKLWKQNRKHVEDRIPAWLFRVCRNRALDVIRKEKPLNTLTKEHAASLKSPENDPSQTALISDDVTQLVGLLAKLPANQQEVIRLKFQQGMTYREIATVTRLSQANVGYLIHTGIKTLRRQMAML